MDGYGKTPGKTKPHRHPGSRIRLGRAASVTTALVLTLTVLTMTTVGMASLGGLASQAAILSAKLSVPQGGAEVIGDNVSAFTAVFAAQTPQSAPKPSSPSHTVSSPKPASSASSAASQSASSAAPQTLKPVKTVTFGSRSGAEYEQSGPICVYNQTAHHKADIAAQLAIKPDVHLNLKAAPQVLIVHTHTTESYASADTGSYDPAALTRNADKSKSVVRVGDEIAAYLEKSGIGVLHDTTYHDYPDYNGAYDRSLATIQKDMKQYPSIKVVLDIHRDAIQYADGSRAKPTVDIDGKKAAQIMVVAPCDEAETSLSIPDWQYNYRFGLRIQQQLVKDYPGLARPLNLCPRRYNMQVCHGSLLVEFGTDVNTLDEAVYAGQLFGSSLSKVLLGLQS